MKVGAKVFVVEDNIIGYVHEIDENGNPTKVITKDKIINVVDKTVKILNWILTIIKFLKSIL